MAILEVFALGKEIQRVQVCQQGVCSRDVGVLLMDVDGFKGFLVFSLFFLKLSRSRGLAKMTLTFF